MAIKKEKIEKRIKTEISEGYICYDASNQSYIDEDSYTVDNIKEAYVHESLELAQETIEDENSPENFEIHQVKITYDILKTMKRKIVYEEIE